MQVSLREGVVGKGPVLAEHRAEGSWQVAGIALLVLATCLMGIVLLATVAASGVFSYSLDDPYIHLAVAEEILAGGYGVNAGEPAAASSSILYPYLVAGLLALGAGSLAPMLITWAASLASVALAVGVFASADLPAPASLKERGFVIPAVCLLVSNLAGLAFTGMEHSLHLALTLAALLGVVRLGKRQRVDAWWIAVLILQPAIRYEGLGVAAAGALVLALTGRFWLATAVALSSVAIVAGFGAWLSSLGLPPLPSSVMVKGSDVAGADGFTGKIAALLENLSGNIGEHSGIAFVVLGVMCVFAANRRLRGGGAAVSPAGLTALFMAVILFGHLVGGRFGWAQRYEAYAFVPALVALPVVFRDRALAILAGRDGASLAIALLLMLLAFAPNVRSTLESPEGSRNISLQQRQMHRLAVEHVGAPVAVNDLGWVSFRNDNYVLDLWGLGSEAARKARTAGEGSAWMAEMAAERGVRLVMIYDSWLPDQPDGWVRLGHLTFKGKLVTAAERDVAMYAADPAYVPQLNRAIQAWSVTLSNRSRFFPDAHENPGYGVDAAAGSPG